VVTLGSITVNVGSLGGGKEAGGRFNVIMSLRIWTRLLMVSRMFSMVFAEAWKGPRRGPFFMFPSWEV